MKLTCPVVWAANFQHYGDSIRQLQSPIVEVDGIGVRYTRRTVSGIVFRPTSNPENEILVVDRRIEPPANFARVIRSTNPLDPRAEQLDCRDGTWLRHPNQTEIGRIGQLDGFAANALHSWANGFNFINEDIPNGIRGLRNPQIGALHAVLAHWSVSNEVATVVMPTGTGKTETMLSLLVAVPCHRVLVVVPTDALRTQIADKFISLGILKPTGVASPAVLYPVVGILRHRPTTPHLTDELFARCNVVVTTSQIAGQSPEQIRERFAFQCDFLFIDEAHHVEAQTWRTLKESFAHKKTLQFTATPFRDDDKVLEGQIIYKYPLRKAQAEGYFRPIHFKPIIEYDPAKADRAIAQAAISELRADRTGKHVVMARADSVVRAKEVFEFYKGFEEFHPIELHSGIKSHRLFQDNLAKLKCGQSRIVVCVDMLGEGFDLPELKIAAFHDIRKSLAVTLQIAGRFTRARDDLGDATFVANVGDVDVTEELKKLYTHDPDWNVLLPELSEKIIGEQIEVRRFNEGFTELPDDIPLRTFRPATSTVVYKTQCAEWQPRAFKAGLDQPDSYARLHFAINSRERTLVIVTARQEPVEWAELEELSVLDWELWILFWDSDRQHLYINSSGNKGVFRKLAMAVAGENVQLIRELEVFRCFSGITRLRLTNIGLTEQIARLISFTGRMGSDVKAALSQAQKRNTRKAVLFGTGFENGSRASVGASRRGRVWSFRRVPLHGFADWCRTIGTKLAAETIDPEAVLKGTLTFDAVESVPAIPALYIDWPDEFYDEIESAINFFIDDGQRRWALHETSIELVGEQSERSVGFRLQHDEDSVTLSLTLIGHGESADYRFDVIGDRPVGVGKRSGRTALQELFYEKPPKIWFADGSSLEGNLHTPLKSVSPPYDRAQIEVIDWTDVNLKKEAQEVERDTSSIQYKIIQTLVESGDWEVIFDEHGTGEIADVVAIKTRAQGSQLVIDIDLYHCKRAPTGKPRVQVEDLYEVCGQAQKSVSWCSQDKQVDLFTHLLRREPKRSKNNEATRFQKGTKEELYRIKESSRSAALRARIIIVQPSLSRSDASDQQLELLAVTENYLSETLQLPLTVIASA